MKSLFRVLAQERNGPPNFIPLSFMGHSCLGHVGLDLSNFNQPFKLKKKNLTNEWDAFELRR